MRLLMYTITVSYYDISYHTPNSTLYSPRNNFLTNNIRIVLKRTNSEPIIPRSWRSGSFLNPLKLTGYMILILISIYLLTAIGLTHGGSAAHRSSSGALTIFAASGLHTHVVTGRTQFWVGTKYVELSMNGGIINSITRLHLVGYFSCFINLFINLIQLEITPPRTVQFLSP
jgi:hypothetical protein